MRSSAGRKGLEVEIEPLQATASAEIEAMTFPVYRPLLGLRQAVRHPEQGDAKPIQPIGFVARLKGAPVGLVLGELPLSVVGSAEMLSLFVAPDWRNRGVGRALVARLEEEVARRGQAELIATYTSGKPSIAALERILWKRGWEAPETRTLSVRFTPQAGLTAAVFEERRMAALTAGLELFSWADLAPEEKRAIRASHQRSPWITPALAPWRFEGGDLDLVSSVGARTVGDRSSGSDRGPGQGGEVVGWVLNHHVSPGVVRFTCSFLRKDLSRRGRIVPLYRESLRRLAATDCRLCTFVTPVEYEGMIGFIQRWIVPVAEFLAETRGSRKRLVPGKKFAAP